jgi:serine phosphatase RsbU (regulator of sigma subunit)/Tfp pilus assembly protein PilF
MATRALLGEVQMIYSMTFWDSIANDCQKLIDDRPVKANKQVMIKLLTIQASAINNLGVVSSSQGKLERALDYFKKDLEIYRLLGNKEMEAYQLKNIGTTNLSLGKVSEALADYYKCLKIYESLNNQAGIAAGLNKIGEIYMSQGDNINAISNFEESLKICLELDDRNGMAIAYGNLGLVYRTSNPKCKYEFCKKELAQKSLDYFLKSLELFEELGKKREVGTTLSNIGSVYNLYGDPACTDSLAECREDGKIIALGYVKQSLAIKEELNDVRGITANIINLGIAHFRLQNITEAEKNGIKGLEMARETGQPRQIQNAASLLSKVYERKNEGIKALEMYKLHIKMRDSLSNVAIKNATARQEIKYEYEKQKDLDDTEHLRLFVIEQEKKEQQKIITWAVLAGLGLVVIFLIFVFNRLRVTRKQKLVIEDQKEVAEIANGLLEEKSREITASITYAKRIQTAILPTAKTVKEHLKESFILYKPKDIVAGDFYWIEHLEGKVLFASADCTGHGVPGAMVSIVCNNGLNRSVREHLLTDPGKILDQTRAIVLEEFEKSEEEVKDGMDIALCCLDGNKLQYAGAHNPLWIVRNGELIETKANKQPIGQFDNPEPFTTHTFDLEKGDVIYLFSDGYVDQFGGEKGKKFKARAFRELLVSIQSKSMEEQKSIVDKTFETWRGSLEQIDDVCVIGVKV